MSSVRVVVRTLTVLLKHWIVEDGELDIPSVGDQVSAGLGVDVEQVELVRADAGEVISTPDLAFHRGAARAVLTGTAVVIASPDGRPAFDVVTVQPGLHAVLLGSGFPAGAESQTVAVSGLLVFEPYLWGDGGLLACSPGIGPVAGIVRAVHELPGDAHASDLLLELDLAM